MPIPMWEDDSEPSFGTPGKAREASSKRRRRFPEGCHTHCLKTDETTELEPGKLESRWYAPGVGFDPGRHAGTRLLGVL